jgi:iron complex transport system ATP-binding protein
MTTALGVNPVASTLVPALRTIDLSVGYQLRRARSVLLDRLNLSLRPGELVCLLGPNGTGKSTLLRTLAGMQRPISGAVEIGGCDVRRMKEADLARRLAVVLTERPVVGALTALDVVELGRYPYAGWFGRLSRRDHVMVDRALEAAGARHLAALDFGKLSDGERQRIMIARALAQEPAVLVMDEPTAFLDVSSRIELMGLVRRIVSDERLALVLSTHDLEPALRAADVVWLIMPDGQLHTGAPSELIARGCIEAAFSRSADSHPSMGAVR